MGTNMVTTLRVLNAGQDDDEQFLLMGARVNFPQLYKRGEPTEASPDGISKGVTVMLNPDADEAICKALNKKIDACLKAKNKGAKVASTKRFLRDGDDSGREEYEGLITLRMGKADSQTLFVYRKGSAERLTESDNEIYSGCYCNVKFKIYFGIKGGKGVWADLIAIQFAEDGTPISAGSMSNEMAIEGFDGASEAEAQADGFDQDTEEEEDGW